MKIPKEWLTQREENRPAAQHRDVPPMTALRIRREWEKLRSRLAEGEELWFFTNPSNTWKKLGHHTGYARVANGRIVESVVVTSQ
jgi:hypothetical protein